MSRYIVSETIYVIHNDKVCEAVVLDVEGYPEDTIYKVRLWSDEVLLYTEWGIYQDKDSAQRRLDFRNI